MSFYTFLFPTKLAGPSTTIPTASRISGMSLSATHVLLIRHGQSEGNAERRFGGHTATPLSLRGRRQATATAEALKNDSITAIYSSDLARAVETAQPLATLTRLPVNTAEAFRERSVGVMEG